MKSQRALKEFGSFSFPKFNLDESALVKVSQQVRNIFGFDTVVEPNRLSIEMVYQKLVSINNGLLTFDDLSIKEHRQTPWAMFYSIDNDSIPFENNALVEDYFKYFQEHNLHRTISTWLHVYLLYYPVVSESFSTLMTNIDQTIQLASSTKIEKLKLWVNTNNLLSTSAVDNFSDKCLKNGVDKTFQSYRLIHALETSQFACHALSRLLVLLSTTLSYKTESEQISLINSLFSQIVTNSELTFTTLRSNVADGLLQSFNGKQAPQKTKKLLKDFFLEFYGDIRTQKAKWIGVSEQAKQVMQQWMVENTLNDFFALLTHVARYDSMADRHWEYRKRFWNAYLQKGVISEAWVALGPTAYDDAKSFLTGGSNVYASLSGAQRSHSSLIMVINGVLITEWSHSGRYRLWDSDNSRPTLYKNKYHRDELVIGNDYQGSHTGSENGNWQYQLSTLIKDLTGVTVSEREYMHD
jgi:hypothetical protein